MSDQTHNFQKLTPIKNAELKIYNKALDFVFDSDDIKNVAISGAYSSGKSSVIETYKNSNPKIRFMHISLAHFEPAEEGDKKPPEGPSEHKAFLEGKILNQLIHQIDPEKIPQTNFKVKQKISNSTIAKSAFMFTFFLILSFYTILFNNWKEFILTLSLDWLKNPLLWTTNKDLLLLSGILCAVILGSGVYSILKAQKNKNIFRKVNIQGNEIEIFEEKDESYFDKYLNEVLYLFENSGANVIVFEDMDRYNVNQIFVKLREVNTLINNKKRAPIRFFYLLRDDVFISKDRTKFFDFIIPIVPVIDSSNSYDQFIEHFKQGGIFEIFDENFLQGLSLYIDDMRILKNIYNEFAIYHNRIQSTELNSNKLLAMISYKNIFPRDFSDLQLGKGFVYTIFLKKADFTRQAIQKINNEIKGIEDEIQLIQKEVFNDIDDLDATYLILNYHELEVAGTKEYEFETRRDLIRAIKENQYKVYHNNRYNRRQQDDLENEFNELKQNDIYLQRKKVIEIKYNKYIQKLKNDIKELQNELYKAQKSRLRDIINKENIDTIFKVNFINEIGKENKFEEIKASHYFPLIKYLMRNGYIDETYPDYMTYFYENSLSRIDKIFLRSVTDQIPKEYTYSLKNPKLVLSRLQLTDFDQEEILNIDLLCHLLKTKQSNKKYLTGFLQQLAETKNYQFISKFLETGKNINVFIDSINHLWPSIIQCILTESNFSEEQKKQYIIYTIYSSPQADIEALNKNNCLTTFISSFPGFLDINYPNVQQIIKIFIMLNVRFAWIDYKISNKVLFNAVYKNDLYQITFDLISLILEEVYGLPKSDDFSSKNYTLINSKPDEPLAQYINKNIDNYLNIILDNCNEFINDEEKAALAILNNPNIDEEKKEVYISYLQTAIENLKDVNTKELWSLLLQQKQIKYSEENISRYYFLSEKELDPYLIQFINGSNKILTFNTDYINNTYGENAVSNFCNDIVTCNPLSNENYINILRSLKWYHESFSIPGISEEKVLLLIEFKIIRMTHSALTFMREHYPEQLLPFITKNITDYTTKVINEDNFILEEMLLVLQKVVPNKYKIELLKYAKEKISIKNKRYSKKVKAHILEYNLDKEDIPFLLETFPNESNSIKEIIKNISIKFIDHIIDNSFTVPFNLLSELFDSAQLTKEMKIELLILCLPNMNIDQAKKYLGSLQMNNFLSLFKGKNPKFIINPTNKQILEIFKDKRWINKFNTDKDRPNYYRAYGRKKLVC